MVLNLAQIHLLQLDLDAVSIDKVLLRKSIQDQQFLLLPWLCVVQAHPSHHFENIHQYLWLLPYHQSIQLQFQRIEKKSHHLLEYSAALLELRIVKDIFEHKMSKLKINQQLRLGIFSLQLPLLPEFI